jgi:hypothetical protein
VTYADIAVADHVVIECPACGASEHADRGMLGGSATIVCRNCGERWPGGRRRNKRRSARRLPRVPRQPPLLEAERRPLVTFSSGADTAWAAKIEGDVWPEAPRRSRLPMLAAAMAASMFVASFFGGREAAVAALPDLAGLYAAIGLPVKLDPLAIEGLAAERAGGGNGSRLTVRGVIRNVSGTEQPVPPLTANVLDSAKTIVGWRSFDAPARVMAAGEAAPFLLELDGVPRQAGKVAIRFRRTAEARSAGEGSTATP